MQEKNKVWITLQNTKTKNVSDDIQLLAMWIKVHISNTGNEEETSGKATGCYSEVLGESVKSHVWNHTHFSLDIHRDTHEQRQIETHFQDVIPVMSLVHGLKNKREREKGERETIGENWHTVICGCNSISIIMFNSGASGKHTA